MLSKRNTKLSAVETVINTGISTHPKSIFGQEQAFLTCPQNDAVKFLITQVIPQLNTVNETLTEFCKEME